MVDEHKLILRMIDLVEKNTELAIKANFSDWNFYLDAVDFIRNFADRFHPKGCQRVDDKPAHGRGPEEVLPLSVRDSLSGIGKGWKRMAGGG